MQTSVNPIGQPVGFAGQLSDNSEAETVSGFSEEATASIAFGAGVAQGSAPSGILNPASSGDTIKGVLVHDYAHAPGSFGDIDSSGVGIVPKAGARVLRKGRALVVIDQSISSIAPFVDRGFCRYSANGGNATLGAWSNVTDSAKNLDLTKVAVFTSSVLVAADGTKIAEIEVDFTNKP